MLDQANKTSRPRLRKAERRERILLELKLYPHVRIAELAERFGVSTETIRRDFDALSKKGLLSRAHGGATVASHQQYPDFDARNQARVEERERIGRRAAALVQPGDSVMVDSGSTTLQMARFLAYEGTQCTVLTNSLPIAMAVGQSAGAQVILCPGDFLPSEAAVVGPDAIEFIDRHHFDRCFIGASGLTPEGVSETVRGFAAIKRAMLRRADRAHLVIDGAKLGTTGMAHVGALDSFASVVTDRRPDPAMQAALNKASVEVLVAA
ncbi:DeoR/GlpR family DNA-binding transcription regulator [Frigidibacter sp. ROC022]|uniref:DeoR/GlpR family DNA-binding transcription regulator n=1 Tax=Frigidibacter sp. ROC022 TaxID=2971796 RepID=UPI00215AD63E|nr:DeoR/GlpR family DNA-binding transcription regulator [Frigidibacter sp. ROC022]MCR8726645.1 DeoR/GlpR family DNA-binding transcription regulator [Frigidibacter sp. ROC022]